MTHFHLTINKMCFTLVENVILNFTFFFKGTVWDQDTGAWPDTKKKLCLKRFM